jgi:hypothetical protein
MQALEGFARIASRDSYFKNEPNKFTFHIMTGQFQKHTNAEPGISKWRLTLVNTTRGSLVYKMMANTGIQPVSDPDP